MLNYLEYLGDLLPAKIAIGLVIAFLLMQVIGELLEFKGKVVPEFLKIRKVFTRKKREKEEHTKTLREVKELLSSVNMHYSEDNITKRNDWMNWVNNRADVYDKSIAEITKSLAGVAEALQDNTKLTEQMFIQSSRDRIIDFATKVGHGDTPVSREEFTRIFKVYKDYEAFLEERKMTNGEIDINYRIIEDSYKERTKDGGFIEDQRGYL